MDALYKKSVLSFSDENISHSFLDSLRIYNPEPKYETEAKKLKRPKQQISPYFHVLRHDYPRKD